MRYVETPTGRIHYRLDNLTAPWSDSGETIVFHHGIGADLNIWGNWLPVLAPRYRLLRFDMRGFGASVVPGDDYPWSFDGLVDDLRAVADAAGVEKFHLVGESIGGTAALAFALKHPQRLRSLTLSNAAARGGLVSNVASWGDMVAKEGQHGWSAFMMRSRFHANGVASEQHDWFARVHETCSMQACFKLADVLLNADLTPEIKRIQTPTLLLAPDGSPFIPAEAMLEMRKHIANAEVQVFAHSKHGLPLSHGAQCAQVLLAFLARQRG